MIVLNTEQLESIAAWMKVNRVAHHNAVCFDETIASLPQHFTFGGKSPKSPLTRSDILDAPKWNLSRYYAPNAIVSSGYHVELQQPVKGLWLVVSQDMMMSNFSTVPWAALQDARARLGLVNLGESNNVNRVFAAHEQEAGWPMGWEFVLAKIARVYRGKQNEQ